MNNTNEKLSDMPQWLSEDENYKPLTDKDTFVNKSILSMLNVISKIKAQDSIEPSKIQVNAAFKVAFTFMFILLVSMSKSFTFVIVMNAYLIVILSFMKAENIVKILKTSFVASLFTLIILLPSAFWGNNSSWVMITLKVFASITSVGMLNHTTKWSSITRALKRFFIPDIFILVLDITIKYIVMLGEFSLNMLYALKLRSVGKNKNKYTSLSGVAGTMFIESKEMAEEMYSAMECRGFTGEYRIKTKFKFTIYDFIYILINVGIVYIYIYFGRI